LNYGMDSYLKYNPDFQLAICTSCQHGIPSNYVLRHFKKHHKATWKTHRVALKKYVEGLVLSAVDMLQWPNSVRVPIDGLKVKEGWSCGEGNCSFCSTSREWIEKHCRSEHGSDSVKQKAWFECHMQTLLEHPHIRF